ncbi:hypothetical protein Syun_018356 [Stephania yunnanensis]|uniref:HIT-type domain-containing protein n=1 Tax=Stephania yunnanensis TaxID=152371 RepID=A0AAP0IS78_9MAGN
MVDDSVIITSENPSTSFQSSPSAKLICRVCQKQFSQYACPRCNSRYCSLHCYKAHSLRCTESFMRDNVVQELKQMKPDDETKKKMLNILKRFHSEEEEMDPMDEDDGDSVLSEETIQKILSGQDLSLDDLSSEEMKCFRRAMASGELSKLIEPWEPWWLKPSARTIILSHDGTRLIHPTNLQGPTVSSHDNLDTVPLDVVPAGPEHPLLPVSKLSSTQPSPLLSIHLVDVVYSYCFTLRLYNGDWDTDALGAALVLFSISSVLGEGGQPETVSEALAHCLEQTCSPAYRDTGGLQLGLGLIDDTMRLLNLGGPAIICLLCDLQRLFEAAGRETKQEKGRKMKSEVKNKLKMAGRKVYYLMCWVHEQPPEVWSPLASFVKVEKKSMSTLKDRRGDAKLLRTDGSNTKGKVLIEEV